MQWAAAEACKVGHAAQVREVWLSSEDTGAYGRDLGSSLPALLRALVEVLPGDGRAMLRLGMTNPPFILEHLEAIAEVGQAFKSCPHSFLHLSSLPSVLCALPLYALPGASVQGWGNAQTVR
jgi:tRNA A37 methylthiotransferase MiaB